MKIHEDIYAEDLAPLLKREIASARKEIAGTILEQLGGRRFLMMTGAKNLFFGSDTNPDLSFKLTIGKWNHVKIELTPMDVYRVTFSKIGKRNRIPAVISTSVHEDIYAEDLVGLFERETGLATRL